MTCMGRNMKSYFLTFILLVKRRHPCKYILRNNQIQFNELANTSFLQYNSPGKKTQSTNLKVLGSYFLMENSKLEN